MARQTLTVEDIVRSGLQATYTALHADGHAFANDGERTFIHVKNGATPFTLTVLTPQTMDGLAVADRTVSIGADEEHFIGPFPRSNYNQAGGEVWIDFSDVTDGTVAALEVPA